ncbi:MAG: diacylglycerol kinase, partial [OM182 bacterium]|nr:diacylglycerol kinase [OM182 bacterium]
LSVFLIPLAFILGETALETTMLLFPIVLVLLVELLNSAVEAVVDRVSLDYHELSKKAKDIASGAVFISLMTFLLIWSVLLFDRLPI